jgi:proteic killer suppression protein
MIVGFRHKGLEAFYRTGPVWGIQAAFAANLSRILSALDVAAISAEFYLPSFKLHPRKGKLKTIGRSGGMATGA